MQQSKEAKFKKIKQEQFFEMQLEKSTSIHNYTLYTFPIILELSLGDEFSGLC